MNDDGLHATYYLANMVLEKTQNLASPSIIYIVPLRPLHKKKSLEVPF